MRILYHVSAKRTNKTALPHLSYPQIKTVASRARCDDKKYDKNNLDYLST